VSLQQAGSAQAVLAIDLGTTEAKAGVVSLDGRLVGLARARYPLDLDESTGRAEQDPEDWWQASLVAAREALDAAGGSSTPEIVAIGLDGHGPSLAAVDAGGRPVCPAMIWLDRRDTGEQAELERTSGLLGWSLGVLPAALWLERHRPGVAEQARWYLNTWEYLGLRMTGRAATSLVPGQRLPEPALLAEVGLPPSKIADPVPAGTILGGLLPDVAASLGVAAGTSVVAGHVDAFSSFHGAGIREPGDALDAGGTAGGFGVYWDRPLDVQGAFCTPAPIPGRFVIGGAMAATGKALDWFRDTVLGGESSTEALIAEAAATSPGANGLLFLPYLAGERSPIWDPEARGVLAGLTLAHGRGHITRAILEAAALSIRHVAEPILSAGVTVRSMVVTGGPAHSDPWNQIKADVTGFAIEVPFILETAVLGSAIVGAVGVGAYADLPTAIAAMTTIVRRLTPDASHRALYDDLYDAYERLYPATAPILRGLGADVEDREMAEARP
jgi:xylulokinase